MLVTLWGVKVEQLNDEIDEIWQRFNNQWPILLVTTWRMEPESWPSSFKSHSQPWTVLKNTSLFLFINITSHKQSFLVKRKSRNSDLKSSCDWESSRKAWWKTCIDSAQTQQLVEDTILNSIRPSPIHWVKIIKTGKIQLIQIDMLLYLALTRSATTITICQWTMPYLIWTKSQVMVSVSTYLRAKQNCL